MPRCSVRGGHVLGPLPPPSSERQGKCGFAWSFWAARSAAGQARRSSQPTPPSSGKVRRHQGSTAAVSIGRCRLPDKSREPTGEPDGLHSSRPASRTGCAHSRLATRAQQMESSVETSAAVADERGPVRAAPWRRAARSTDAAASRCRVLEDQSDREDGSGLPKATARRVDGGLPKRRGQAHSARGMRPGPGPKGASQSA
jgi:hypothetical protein